MNRRMRCLVLGVVVFAAAVHPVPAQSEAGTGDLELLLFHFMPSGNPLAIESPQPGAAGETEILSPEERVELERFLPKGTLKLIASSLEKTAERPGRRAILVLRRLPDEGSQPIRLPLPSEMQHFTLYIQEIHSEWWSTVPSVEAVSERILIERTRPKREIVVRIEAVSPN